MRKEETILNMFDKKFEFGGDSFSFNGLVKFHREYVDDDYPFEEWFNDHVEIGVIKPLDQN